RKKFSKWPFNHPYTNYEESIRSFYLDEKGKLWVGVINGMVIIDPVSGATSCPEVHFQQLSYSSAPTIRGICYWNSDTLAIATDRGAHFYKQSTHAVSPVFAL